MKASARRGPASTVAPVEHGTAELVPDTDRPGGWTLLLDGAPQSYVDVDDPTYLDFEYMRRLAIVVDAIAPAGQPLQVLHLGGGALTMARYIAATRPHSGQRVVEHDAALTELIRQTIPLRRRAGVRVHAADARSAVEATPDGRFDLVIADVYDGSRMPRALASVEFAAQAARILRPDGVYAVNVADMPPADFTRTHVATLATAFPEICVLASPALLRGKRHGNAIIAAARTRGRLPLARLDEAAGHTELTARVLAGGELERFVGGARPVGDADATDSPLPPPELFRRR